MSIHLSLIMPDPELEHSPLAKAVALYAANLTRKKSHPANQSTPGISLTFALPSKKLLPPFEGMQLTEYRSGDAVVEARVAVPQRIMQMSQPRAYVLATLKDVVDAVEVFFSEIEVAFSAAEHMNLIDAIARELAAEHALN